MKTETFDDCNGMFMALGSEIMYNWGSQITQCPALLQTAGAMADSLKGATCMKSLPQDSVSSKLCSKCGITKSLADFYVDRNKYDGHRPRCKECDYSPRQRTPQPKSSQKRCPRCNEVKPRVEFTAISGTTQERGYCRECVRRYGEKRRANPSPLSPKDINRFWSKVKKTSVC